jgi:secretion/DNA translocation related TadE-like protein
VSRRPLQVPCGDRGAASLWLLVVGLLLVAAGVFGAAVGAATVARHRAQAAADLGALAGARWALWGPATACPEAAAIVAANGGRLAWCRLVDADVLIGVEVVLALRGLSRTARAAARAGPVRTSAEPAAGATAGTGEGTAAFTGEGAGPTTGAESAPSALFVLRNTAAERRVARGGRRGAAGWTAGWTAASRSPRHGTVR